MSQEKLNEFIRKHSLTEENVANMLPQIGLNGSAITRNPDEATNTTVEDMVDELNDEIYDDAARKIMSVDGYKECFTQPENVTEGMIEEDPDIFYNKIKYENGDINLLFITGYSGGGKSTFSNSEKKFLREVVDMDKIILFTNKPDEYYKKLGKFAYSFMTGPGKQFREREDKDITIKNMSDGYRKKISKSMINYAEQYASAHKNIKLVMEGVWIYRYINPADIEQYAIYIKGTSLKTSTERAVKRDNAIAIKNGTSNALKRIGYAGLKTVMAAKDALFGHMKKFQKYYLPKYIKQMQTESIKTSKKAKNTAKHFIHDAAKKIQDMTESTDELHFSSFIKEYINDSHTKFNFLIEESVMDTVINTELDEDADIDRKLRKDIVEFNIKKARLKACKNELSEKETIDLQRDMVDLQKKINAAKKAVTDKQKASIEKLNSIAKRDAMKEVDRKCKDEKHDDVTESANDLFTEQRIFSQKTIEEFDTTDKRLDPYRRDIIYYKEKLRDAKNRYQKTKSADDAKTVRSLEDRIKEEQRRLNNTMNEIKKSLEEKDIKNIKKDIDKDFKKNFDLGKALLATEAANMDDEIKPIVEALEKKGYMVKYASPGHKDLRKKEDAEPDGVYYGKLYSDARIMFDDVYDFGGCPKYWHWRDVDNCSYLDISPFSYDEKDGTPDEAFKKWKDNYMNSLKEFVKELKPREKVRTESMDDIIALMEESILNNEDLYAQNYNHEESNDTNISNSSFLKDFISNNITAE